MSIKIDERFWDSNVTLDTIIWLPSCVADKPDSLTESLDMWPDEIREAIGCPDACVEDAEDFMEWCGLNDKHGFLVEAKTPVDASWGHCRMGWLYTESLDAAFVGRLEKWKESLAESSVPEP